MIGDGMYRVCMYACMYIHNSDNELLLSCRNKGTTRYTASMSRNSGAPRHQLKAILLASSPQKVVLRAMVVSIRTVQRLRAHVVARRRSLECISGLGLERGLWSK